ncbi:MAG TPA: AMP-binding protein [Stellaceae bacterium]|nr:AMP-binding protein [Stellaceae bacterium]
MLIPRAASYDEIYRSFRWQIPERYNIAWDVCDRHAQDPHALALIHERPDGSVDRYSFRQIQGFAHRLANLLLARGLKTGDRVLLYLGQHPATAIAHVACWKAGLVSVPCSVLFGVEALDYRIENTGALALLTDLENYPAVAEAQRKSPRLRTILLVDGEAPDTLPFWPSLERASDGFTTRTLSPQDPAFINYTSGTTGWPKGALQGHRSILGHMPGAEFVYDFFPQDRDVMWSPADWSWIAGLMDVLMPAWFHGKPVLTYRASKFDPEQAFHMIGKHGVRTSFLTPTMLKMMRQVADPVRRFGVDLRAVMSGGESVGKEILEWANRTLGAAVNEAYGQTECNLVLGNCARVLAPKPGSLGRALPGHVAAIVDDTGLPVPVGEVGNIAFRRPDPVMMLEYWRNPNATAEKFAGDWLITGDLGFSDEEGYFWFRGRADDVITSAGYRIGPWEIEDALMRHPAVAMAAVIGVPDPVRTESIKAFIVPAPGVVPNAELADEIRDSVRTRLAKHEYPRAIEFVETLPMTATGKILRRELHAREKK